MRLYGITLSLSYSQRYLILKRSSQGEKIKGNKEDTILQLKCIMNIVLLQKKPMIRPRWTSTGGICGSRGEAGNRARNTVKVA